MDPSSIALGVATSQENLDRFQQERRRQLAARQSARTPPLTIALSREEGTPSAAIARKLGEQLHWSVYDRELLDRIANAMKVEPRLLHDLDEKRVDWLQEAFASFMELPAVSEGAFLENLRKTILSLGEVGCCVIVGRGAPHILPAASTLRVRLIAEKRDRIEAIRRERGLSARDAQDHMESTDRLRSRFLHDFFFVDVANPLDYDMVLNTSSLKVAACVEIILAALSNRANTALPAEAGTGL
jgi:cytidylate kinase